MQQSHFKQYYVSQVRSALDQIGRPAERWTAEDIRPYLYYLRTERRCSSTTLNQAIDLCTRNRKSHEMSPA